MAEDYSPLPRPIGNTFAPAAGVVQNVALAAMSLRRFSNRSPQR
jgi:hypothetical protein